MTTPPNPAVPPLRSSAAGFRGDPGRARAEIVVDVAAIRHNVRLLKELTGTRMMTVVKADGYGHGLVESGRAAREGGADWLGVATIDEALALRTAGDTGRVLCWLTVPGEDWAAAIERDVDVSAYSVAELDEIAQVSGTGRRAGVQLKVDTGLSRGGAPLHLWPDVVARARRGEQEGSWRVTGVWSHFSSSDEPEDAANDAQEQAFREALRVADEAGLRPEVRHLSNSAGAILRPGARFDLVRCGIASYGLDPAPGVTPDIGLRPAMTARAQLAMVKHVDAGAAVSYGRTWTAEHATTLGLVPVGYGDGLMRAGGNRAEVLVAGRRRKVRGRICMDQLVVDLEGDDPGAGAEATIFGTGEHGEPTAQDWAEACGTISYEVVTRIGGRFTRRHVDSEASAKIRT
jgi:alanine racemase